MTGLENQLLKSMDKNNNDENNKEREIDEKKMGRGKSWSKVKIPRTAHNLNFVSIRYLNYNCAFNKGCLCSCHF